MIEGNPPLVAVGAAKPRPSGCHCTAALLSASLSIVLTSPSILFRSCGCSELIEYMYTTPSVQETARVVPPTSQETCLAGLDWSRR